MQVILYFSNAAVDKPILRRKNQFQPGIRTRYIEKDTLSAIDIRKTNKLYKCPVCGRSYFDKEASLTSPEYNNQSTNRTYQCKWRITVNDGEQIQLKIYDLDIFESIDCKTDYLEVRDGYWHKSPLLGHFCGSNIPEVIISTSKHMIINYVSSHIEHRGFAANYDIIQA